MIDGAAFSVMVGIGESYLSAFALALGMGDLVAGLIAGTPMVIGGLLQLGSPFAVRWVGSHRRWVVACVVMQSASFLPLIAGALVGWLPATALFLVAAIYWGAGLASGPSWNTWMGTIVPAELRPKFFAWRSRVCQACVLAGLVSGGLLLQSSGAWEFPLLAFAWLFLIAFLCRLVSAWFLTRQSEPAPIANGLRSVTFREFLTRCWSQTDGRLLLFFLSLQMTVWIAAPYFTPFMFKQLHMSYAVFMTLTASPFLTKILMFPIFGRVAQRHGARRLLWLGSAGIAPLPALWLVLPNSFAYLLAVNLLAGVVWAAYELAVILLFFETIPAEERTGVLTIFNFANTLAQTAGALAGGLMMLLLDHHYQTYVWIFVVSTLGRCAALVLLIPVRAHATKLVAVVFRVDSVRPSAGSLDRPILASIPEEDAASR